MKTSDSGLMNVRSIFESGVKMFYTIGNYSLVKRGDKQYGQCTLYVRDSNGKSIDYCKVPMSWYLTRLIEKNPEKYIGVTFSFYNTSPEYTDCPLKLIEYSDGNFKLYNVVEKSWVMKQVPTPFGLVEKLHLEKYGKSQYLRFLKLSNPHGNVPHGNN